MAEQDTFDGSIRQPVVQRPDAGWGMFAFIGALMVAVGIAAVAYPFVATVVAEIVIGAALIAVGACQAVQAFFRSQWKGRTLTGLSAMLAIAAGLLLLADPFSGMITLTVVMGAYFLAIGLFRIVLAFTLRPHDSWRWLLTSGVLALILGLIVAVQLPQVSTWLLGLLVGLDLMFSGAWAVLIGLAQRDARHAVC